MSIDNIVAYHFISAKRIYFWKFYEKYNANYKENKSLEPTSIILKKPIVLNSFLHSCCLLARKLRTIFKYEL
ncbi:hypothetical protein A946_00015 [Methylacidiphilum kamchatkense Kam1]|uniref:Uncharacterized protein n=1 Tax=Methylacidiphilum kamchatkense Kam1 TaxID=1202785 RepID=A0A0C1RW60_9BACT|nr:hypothetical protein A946_00015 [Methylacidiphilum kamchatkense Kam1]QDQ42887.1 hypothetical protein kam1_1672 [Methylacidiphilum kamchatkense Kam1]